MLHELLTTWFHWVEQWGYVGVFVLMALESSIVPVPSEVVLPPAAFWASQGRMDFWGVVLAGTLGSYAGSVASYYMAQWVGEPVLRRYGKYVMLSEDKLLFAERWVREYGVVGIFVSRMLPVVRHLISMPAGIFRMRFGAFSISTLAGAGIWCTVLSAFGAKVLGDSPELLNSPEDMVHVMKAKLIWFVGGVLALGVLYAGVKLTKSRLKEKAPA